MSSAKKLGRGLEALLGAGPQEEHVRELAVDLIVTDPGQPRKNFKEESLAELADSIREHGVISPLIVRRTEKGEYLLVAGERRLRAAKHAELKTVPVLVRELTAQNAEEIALIENLQREDLNPVEEGEAYAAYLSRHKCTQEELARLIGKSRPYVANMLRVSKLPGNLKTALSEGKITFGQARPILSLLEGIDQKAIGERILKENLSAREAEDLVRKTNAASKHKAAPPAARDEGASYFAKLEEELKLALGAGVTIKNGRGKEIARGSISISYENEDEFKRLIALLKGED